MCETGAQHLIYCDDYRFLDTLREIRGGEVVCTVTLFVSWNNEHSNFASLPPMLAFTAPEIGTVERNPLREDGKVLPGQNMRSEVLNFYGVSIKEDCPPCMLYTNIDPECKLRGWGKELEDPNLRSAFERRFWVLRVDGPCNPFNVDTTTYDERNKLVDDMNARFDQWDKDMGL